MMSQKKGIILMLVVTVGILFGSVAAHADTAYRVEGDGYDTPEEAIVAFAEALRAGDLNAAVSTFAVETYCDRYDTAGLFQRMGSIQPTFSYSSPVAPAENEMMRQINIATRRENIITQIRRPLYMVAADRMSISDQELLQGAGEAYQSMQTYVIPDFKEGPLSDLEELAIAFQNIPDFSNMTISEPIPMAAFYTWIPMLMKSTTMKIMFRNALISGAEGVTELGIVLENEEEVYLVNLNLVRYDGRWYNGSLNTTISNMWNIEVNRQGIMGGNKEFLRHDAEFEDLLSSPEVTMDALAEAVSVAEGEELTPEQLREACNDRHQELLNEISRRLNHPEYDTTGISIDFSRPLLEQMDQLKALADASGEAFYLSDLCDIWVMDFDELLDYFGMGDLQ